jgi:predicted nucleic acid-binding protein
VIAYLDASVILRIVFGEENPLAQWRSITHGVSSILAHVECRRAVDRMRFQPRHARFVASYRADLIEALEQIELADISDSVIVYAAQPLPFAIRSLDAIHLATALDWKRRNKKDLYFATHDDDLADAARHVGFEVIGA